MGNCTKILSVAIVVALMSESSKSSPIKVYGEGLVGCAQSVDAHVEFPAPHEHGVHQIPLADVGLRGVVLVEGFPPGDFVDFVEDEDASALALGSLELVSKNTGFMIHSDLPSLCALLNSS